MSLVRRLSTSRGALPPTHASTNLGGITVYALNRDDLDLGLAELLEALELSLGQELLVTKPKVITGAREVLSSPVPERLASAGFGKILSLGRAGGVPCLTVNGRVFRLYVHANRYAELRSWVGRVEEVFRERTTLTAEELLKMEATVGERPLNWFCADKILWHMAYRGIAIWVGDGIFVSSGKVLADAIRAHRN